MSCLAANSYRLSLVGMLTRSIEGMKWFGVFAMLVDHVSRVLSDQAHSPGTVFGRLAFPMFALVCAVNAEWNSRNIGRFASRLFLWGCVSQVPYMYALGWSQLNVLFTLSMGVVGGSYLVDRAGGSVFVRLFVVWTWVVLSLVELAGGPGLPCDFGTCGVAAVVIFSVGASSLCDDGVRARLVSFFFFVLGLFLIVGANMRGAGEYGAVYFWAVLAAPFWIPVVSIFQPERVPGWVFYVIYPAHLLLLAIVRALL